MEERALVFAMECEIYYQTRDILSSRSFFVLFVSLLIFIFQPQSSRQTTLGAFIDSLTRAHTKSTARRDVVEFST